MRRLNFLPLQYLNRSGHPAPQKAINIGVYCFSVLLLFKITGCVYSIVLM